MVFKRWIVVAVINALVLSSAFQIFGRNMQAVQAQARSTTNLDATPSEFAFLPLVMRYSGSTPTPTPTITSTPTPTITNTPTITKTGTITTTPTNTFTPSFTPTFNGTPPAICEWHYLPNKTETFSYELGPVIHKFSMVNNMAVSVVRISANLSATNCWIGQQININGNDLGSWTYLANDYNIYTETQYVSLNVHVGNQITYTAYAANYNCTGMIKGATNYVEVCGNPIP